MAIRLDNNNRPGTRLRDPIKVEVVDEGDIWCGVDFDPAIEVHEGLTYWLCHKGMIPGVYPTLNPMSSVPNDYESYRGPFADDQYFPEQRTEIPYFTQPLIGKWYGPFKGLPMLRLLG
jgi:hypothetical protein